MRIWLMALVLGLAWIIAGANDTAVFGVGGSMTRLTQEHPTIRMVRETVTLRIMPLHFTVDAEFLFENTGEATTVTMGFPEHGSGDGAQRFTGKRTAYRRFTTSVDGTMVAVRRQPAATTEHMYTAWWTKEVSFAAHQQRRVRVQYESPIGEDSLGGRWASYHFTGGNWAGMVEESVLQVEVALPGPVAVYAPAPLTQQGRRFTARWRQWQAEAEARIYFLPCDAQALALRGAPVQEEEPAFNWVSPQVTVLPQGTTTGRLPAVASPFTPPALLAGDGARADLALTALRDFLQRRFPDEPAPRIAWNNRTKTATFAYRGQVIRVQQGSRQMQVQPGNRTVALPAPAEVRSFGRWSSPTLYVPAAPLLALFNGVGQLDAGQRTFTMTMPPVTEPEAMLEKGRFHEKSLAVEQAAP